MGRSNVGRLSRAPLPPAERRVQSELGLVGRSADGPTRVLARLGRSKRSDDAELETGRRISRCAGQEPALIATPSGARDPLRKCKADTPHPAFGHLLPASGEKDLMRDPSPREAGRGCAKRRVRGRVITARVAECAVPLLRMTAPPKAAHARNAKFRTVRRQKKRGSRFQPRT